MKRYSLFLVLQSYIGVFVSIYLTYAGYNIETVVLGLLTGYVAVFIMMAFLIVKYLGIGIGKWSNLKEQLAFALPTIPSNVSSWVVDSRMFLSPFAVLLPAVLPEYYEKGDIGEVDKYLSYSMKYYLLLTIPAAVGMSVLSKPLLYIITTPEIALGGYMVTPFVCLGAIFMGMYGITNNILILEKNTMILGKLWIVVAISNIVLNLLLVPYLNILGAAIATLFCYILAFAVTAIASKKTMRLPFNIKELLKIVIAAAIMGIAVYMMHPNGIINVLISIIAGVIIYFATIFILKAVTIKEISIFKDLLH